MINWRPGAEGFLYLGDGSPTSGLLDQVAALEWVRENIAAFGGDPGNVTVFGESAGAMSIGTLLSMPRAEGLFRRAILQSGAAHHVIPADDALRIGRYLAEKLGVPPTREAIAAVPASSGCWRRRRSSRRSCSHIRTRSAGASDVVTSTDAVAARRSTARSFPAPDRRIAAGAGAQVDVIVGTNTDDWRLFLVITAPSARSPRRS